MGLSNIAPWLVLIGYAGLIWTMVPRRVNAAQFFGGGSRDGGEPGLWLLVASAAITWIFAKSISNAASLGASFGPWGGVGYGFYYLCFVVVGVAIYLIRTRGGFASLSSFLVAKYGPFCAKHFLLAIAIRLFNEVWSNTKVGRFTLASRGAAITG